MSPYEYLQRFKAAVPEWLARHQPGDPFSREQFFGSRLVYYPGSGSDGHPVKVFGSTHAATVYIYVDYCHGQSTLERQLADPESGFLGYHTLDRLQLRQQDLVPGGWSPSRSVGDGPGRITPFATVAAAPFGFLEILERDSGFGDEHGAQRLAILFLGADGIAAYDALFCQRTSVGPPFAVVLQDHGFGGNYNRFGEGGLLAAIASQSQSLPSWLLVAENTKPWSGYERVPDVTGDFGGAHAYRRYLYRSLNGW